VATQFDTQPIGEPDTPVRPSKVPVPPSIIEPLPYYPQLKGAIKTVISCILLTYLETHYAARQDSLDGSQIGCHSYFARMAVLVVVLQFLFPGRMTWALFHLALASGEAFRMRLTGDRDRQRCRWRAGSQRGLEM
jgi:hypothetical protein